MAAKKTTTYSEDSIQILTGLKPVRVRPAMYIGDTGKRGLHHLVWEILDNSVDEAMAGYCTQINVTVGPDGRTMTVEDNGRGIPTAPKQEDPERRSTLEIVLTELHAGGKFGGEGSGYEASGGLHGVGASCVNALSELLQARVWRDGGVFEQTFTRGQPSGPCQRTGDSRKTGTAISFVADPHLFGQIGVSDVLEEFLGEEFTADEEYAETAEQWKQLLIEGPVTAQDFLKTFAYLTRITNAETLGQVYEKWMAASIRNTRFDDDLLVRRFRETAFLNGGLKIVFENKKTGRKESFQYDGGIADYVKYLASSRTNIYPAEPFMMDNKTGRVQVQASIQYAEEDEETVYTFANNIHTVDGGTHLAGFRTALTRVVNQFARSTGILKEKDVNLTGDDIREGIVAVISIRVPQPQFEGQTKAKLGSPEAEGAVNRLLGEALTEYFEKNPAVAKMIGERAQRAAKARAAAKKASESIKRQGFLGRVGSLPGKLSDCDAEDMASTELYIVEGDSAAGSAKGGRNPITQAVLPIRGKIINPEKHDFAKLLANSEVSALISAIGTGILDDFNINDLRYGKVVIMTDADDDGAHIATLLLTFFYRFMRPLVTEGHLYLAKPPLYRITVKGTHHYVHTNEELAAYRKRHGDRIEVTRFKGLGEMDADELGATTMAVGSRQLIKVGVEDADEASRMLSVLMGNNVGPRKEHIIGKSAQRAALLEEGN